MTSDHPIRFAAKRPILAALKLRNQRRIEFFAEHSPRIGSRNGRPTHKAVIRRCLPFASMPGAGRWVVRVATDRVGQVAYFVALEDGSPISFAALWEHWGKSNNALESFNNHYDDRPHLVFRFPLRAVLALLEPFLHALQTRGFVTIPAMTCGQRSLCRSRRPCHRRRRVTLLRRRPPQTEDILRGSSHRRVRAAIVRWARRWDLNTKACGRPYPSFGR